MKRVPPNVTMKPGFDGPSSSRDTMPPMRHLSGDTLLAAPGRTGQVAAAANRSVPGAVGVGGGPVGIRNTARHASGDSVYSNMSSEGGNLAGHNMRRYRYFIYFNSELKLFLELVLIFHFCAYSLNILMFI